MKKRIKICLSAFMTGAFTLSFMTACNSEKGDSNQADNSNIEKEMNASECSSELSSAIATSIAKANYSIKIVGSADEGRSSVVNIECDADTQHVTVSSTQDYLGVITNYYAETYLFVRDGKYYSSTRTSDKDTFSNPSELGSKTEFDTSIANNSLNSVIGKFAVDDNAEVTYIGTKKNTDISVTATSVGEVNGVKTELFVVYTIKNGLVGSVFQRISEYDESDVPTIKSENTITVRYDIGVVEFPANS